jgi:hypothetical protein
VVVSSDLRELMLICDRIGVMSAGRMTAVFERGNWTQDALLAAAFAGFGRDVAGRHAASGCGSGAARGFRGFDHRTTLMTQPPVSPSDAGAQDLTGAARARCPAHGSASRTTSGSPVRSSRWSRCFRR